MKTQRNFAFGHRRRPRFFTHQESRHVCPKLVSWEFKAPSPPGDVLTDLTTNSGRSTVTSSFIPIQFSVPPTVTSYRTWPSSSSSSSTHQCQVVWFGLSSSLLKSSLRSQLSNLIIIVNCRAICVFSSCCTAVFISLTEDLLDAEQCAYNTDRSTDTSMELPLPLTL